MGARGNSGVILSQILRGLVDDARAGRATASTAHGRRGARRRPSTRRLRRGDAAGRGHDPHRRARGGRGAPRRRPTAGGSLVDVLDAARAAGAAALDRTPELLPVLKEAGVVDAGGAGFLLLLDALLHVVDGRPLPEPDEGAGADAERSSRSPTGTPRPMASVDVGDLRYEVMYFLEARRRADRRVQGRWAGIGDSIVVVGGDGIWNCHIHTDDIGAAIEAALDSAGARARSASPTCSSRSRRSAGCARRRSRAAPAPGSRAGHDRGRRGRHRRRHRRSLPLARRAGHRGRGGQSMNPSTAQILEAVEARQRRPGRDPARTTRTSSRWPSRSTR